MLKDVDSSLPSECKICREPNITEESLWQYMKVFKRAVGFLNGLPDVASFTIYRHADGSAWME